MHHLEKAIETGKDGLGKGDEKADLVSQRKREDLKNKMKEALKKLEERKKVFDESRNLIINPGKDSDENTEEVLRENSIALTQQTEGLKKDLDTVMDGLGKHKECRDGLEGISAEYQAYKELKDKEGELGKALDIINEKLQKRKEWAVVDTPRVGDDTAESYGDILKRMSDENLNMADLIHELEETKETLSKEREITSETAGTYQVQSWQRAA